MTYYTASFRDLSRMIKTAGSGGPAGLDAYGVNPPVKPKPPVKYVSQDDFIGGMNTKLSDKGIDPNYPLNQTGVKADGNNIQSFPVGMVNEYLPPSGAIPFEHGMLSTVPRTGMEGAFAGMDGLTAVQLQPALKQRPTLTPSKYPKSVESFITNEGLLSKIMGPMSVLGMLPPGMNLMNPNRTGVQKTVDGAALAGSAALAIPPLASYFGPMGMRLGAAVTPAAAAAAWPMAAYYGVDALLAAPITDGTQKMTTFGNELNTESNIEAGDRVPNPQSGSYTVMTHPNFVEYTAHDPGMKVALDNISQWEAQAGPDSLRWTNEGRPIREVAAEIIAPRTIPHTPSSGLSAGTYSNGITPVSAFSDNELKDMYRDYLPMMAKTWQERQPDVHVVVHDLMSNPKYEPENPDQPILVPAQPSGYVWSTRGKEAMRARTAAARRVIAAHQAHKWKSPTWNAWRAGFIWPKGDEDYVYNPEATYQIASPSAELPSYRFGPAGPRPENLAYQALNDPEIMDRLRVNTEDDALRLYFNTHEDNWVPLDNLHPDMYDTLVDIVAANQEK